MTMLSDLRRGAAPTGRSGAPSRAAELTDGELLGAVRAGDSGAFAVLYERYADSVHRLARRLCRDEHEADDVVSEVFANTLRAIQRGGGPRDEFGLYALRSVRNTVIKLRTRTDTARTQPAELAELDRAAPEQTYDLAGDVEQAFAELPERFRQVLWTTAVEGHTPTELAAVEAGAGAVTSGLDPGAVASLSQRARKALGRSYLRVHTHRPSRHPECNRVRGYLPGYVQHTAGLATAKRIDAHLAHCAECSQIRDEMRELNGKLRTLPWLALLGAAVRRLALGVATAGVPAAATAVAPIVAIAVAGSMVVRDRAIERTSSVAALAYAEAEPLPRADATDPAATTAAADTAASHADPTGTPSAGPTVATVVDPGPPLSGPEGAPLGTGTPAVGPAGQPLSGPEGAPLGDGGVGETGGPVGPTTLPGVVAAVDPLTEPVGGVVGGAVGGVTDSVVPAVGTGVDTLLGDVNGTVGDVGDVIAALPDGLPAVIDESGQLVTGVVDTVDHTLDTVDNVTGAVSDTVDTTVSTLVATADEVVGDVGDVVAVDPNAPVTDLVDDMVGDDGVVPNLVGTPTTTTPAPACVVNLLGICL